MLRLRQAAAVSAVFLSGLGVAACTDRDNASQGNEGGKPVGATSPTPQNTGGTAAVNGTPPPSATNTIGTLPDLSTDPQTKTDNPIGGGDESGDAGQQAGG